MIILLQNYILNYGQFLNNIIIIYHVTYAVAT